MRRVMGKRRIAQSWRELDTIIYGILNRTHNRMCQEAGCENPEAHRHQGLDLECDEQAEMATFLGGYASCPETPQPYEWDINRYNRAIYIAGFLAGRRSKR